MKVDLDIQRCSKKDILGEDPRRYKESQIDKFSSFISGKNICNCPQALMCPSVFLCLFHCLHYAWKCQDSQPTHAAARGRCLQISPGPQRGSSASPEQGKNTHGNVCFLLILKNDCFNDRLKTWSIQMAAMNAKAKNSMLRRGQGRETWEPKNFALRATLTLRPEDRNGSCLGLFICLSLQVPQSYAQSLHKIMAIDFQKSSPFASLGPVAMRPSDKVYTVIKATMKNSMCLLLLSLHPPSQRVNRSQEFLFPAFIYVYIYKYYIHIHIYVYTYHFLSMEKTWIEISWRVKERVLDEDKNSDKK